jgi:hypothetical protein
MYYHLVLIAFTDVDDMSKRGDNINIDASKMMDVVPVFADAVLE